MQNYALQTLLERRGHTVTTLNFPVVEVCPRNKIHHFLSNCRRFIHKLFGYPDVIWVDIFKEYRKRVELATLQKNFLDKKLNLYSIKAPLSWQQIKDFNFDAYLVGSDQVWRPRYNRENLTNLFLDFVEGKDVKRVSYAASFGTDKWEMSNEETERCSHLAKLFDAISVRESSGIELCKSYLGVDAIHVIDPTLMLDAEDYLSLCGGFEHPKGDYIAVYSLDYTKEKLALLNTVSKRLNIPLHFIGSFSKSGYPSMESWLEGIAYAKYVITDSFHGVAFSIIFQKQFVTLGNPIRGNGRFDSLFATLGIPMERQTNEVNKILSLFQQLINYDDVNSFKERNRIISNNFLDKAGL